MGHKIFVSYKFKDSDVRRMPYGHNGTVRDYVDDLQRRFDASDNVNRAEAPDDDMSQLSEGTIWASLRDRIWDSTLTIVMISKNMKDPYKAEAMQWIPREVSFSLKETARSVEDGVRASRTNAMLAVVVPDVSGSYGYYFRTCTCCASNCVRQDRESLFRILGNNMFNSKVATRRSCDFPGGIVSNIWYGDFSYIPCVKWDDFVSDAGKHINTAYRIRDHIDDYTLAKDIPDD